MKKIMIITITMVFALALGAYAKEEGKQLYNGITDFTGRSVDSAADLALVPQTMHATSVEGANAGGPRSTVPDKKLYNGITDFTGRSVDSAADLPL